MRTTKLVTLNEEIQLIDKLGDELLSGGFNAYNSVINMMKNIFLILHKNLKKYNETSLFKFTRM